MTDATVTSSCLCGCVRIEAALPVSHMGHCHCDNCRRAHGAGIWTWATFSTDQVRVVEGATELSKYVSDTDATRSFCRVCGSTLLYESPRWPGKIDLSVANIEGELGMSPSRHAYADRSPVWCPILDDLPQLGGESGMEPLGDR